MKALIIFLFPAFLLIGCGQMQTNEGTASDAISNLEANGALSEEDLQNLEQVDESLLSENLEITETDNPNSVIMKLGGAELLIDFIDNLSGAPEETAMIINGVDVPSSVASNSGSFQGLIASLVTSQLEDINIFGLPVNTLVNAGLQLISKDKEKNDFSNIFGSLIKGAFNLFSNKTPFGSIFDSIGKPILDSVFDNDDNDNQSGQNEDANDNTEEDQDDNNNGKIKGKEVLNAVSGILGGVLTSVNPLLGGAFSLISNLFN